MKCPKCNGKMRPGSASIHRSNLGMLADVALFDRLGAQTQYLYFQPAGKDEAVHVDHNGSRVRLPEMRHAGDRSTSGRNR